MVLIWIGSNASPLPAQMCFSGRVDSPLLDPFSAESAFRFDVDLHHLTDQGARV